MELSKGYKRTEIGEIPENWVVAKVEELVSISTGSKNTEDNKPDGQYPFFVRSQELEKIDTFSYEKEAVLTAGDGVGTGKIFHYIDGKFDAHQRVYIMSDFRNQTFGKYFYWQFSTLFFNRIMSMTAKSSVDSVRREVIADMLLPLPPVKEQEAIAEALSDADTLITSLEKLIEKKKTTLEGVKRELFSSNNSVNAEKRVKFGQVLTYEQPTKYIVTNSQLTSSGATPVLTANKSFILGYTEEAQGIKTDVPVIIFDDFTTDKKFVNFPFKVRSSALKILKARTSDIDLLYVFNLMQQINFPISDHKRYWITEYQEIEIPLPSANEQIRISSILRDFSSDLEKLGARLNKAKKIKSGMMQELLTGRMRLI